MPTARLFVAASITALLTSFTAQAQSFTALYAFGGNAGDGATPISGVIYDQGVLYGTTYVGGSLGCSGTGCGTAFRINAKTGAERVLHRFRLGHGGSYLGGGLAEVNGTFYGTAENGGVNSGGVVFQLDPATHKETVLHRFRGSDGAYPFAGVIYANNLLYGTTFSGGAAGEGTIFQLDPATNKETTIYSFKAHSDGAAPMAGVIYQAGALYGTTTAGGGAGCVQVGGCGTVFKFDLGTGIETILHAFTGGADGNYPVASLTYANNTLYGTTRSGGTSGVIFSMDPTTGAETVLYSFTGKADGGDVWGPVLYLNGTLYGTTVDGGGTNCGLCFGTVYGFNLSTNTETVLYSFTGGSDGANPQGPLTSNEGVLYGTASAGGIAGSGTVFAVTP